MPQWLSLYYDEPIALVSGSGRRVIDGAGRSYLDFFAGILTNMVGYDIPEIREAIERQLRTGVVHTSTLYLIEPQVELAERIAALSGIPDAKVFFTSSGTEANEAALLLATQARHSNQVLALRHSYHGRSFGAMALTGIRGWSASSLAPVSVHYVQSGYRYRSPFRHLDDEAFTAACVEDLRDVLATSTAGDVACLVAEPIQGVGGFVTPPDGFFGAMHEVLAEEGILFVSDEVQTGWGRTGEHFWGIGAHRVVPDVMTFAKGLGNGLAIGGVVARAEVMDCLRASSISTFGGNPLATTAALATLDYVLAHDLQGNAREQGSRLMDGLRAVAQDLPVVGEVRGKGLMVGVELVVPGTTRPDARAAAVALEVTRDKGVLLGKGGLYGNVLRIAPPLTVTAEEVDEALEALEAALRAADDDATRRAEARTGESLVGGRP
jgi:4-aminobutyrate aminotransferase